MLVVFLLIEGGAADHLRQMKHLIVEVKLLNFGLRERAIAAFPITVARRGRSGMAAVGSTSRVEYSSCLDRHKNLIYALIFLFLKNSKILKRGRS